LVEIEANRPSCDPFITLLFKQVLDVVMDTAACLHRKENAYGERSSPRKGVD